MGMIKALYERVVKLLDASKPTATRAIEVLFATHRSPSHHDVHVGMPPTFVRVTPSVAG